MVLPHFTMQKATPCLMTFLWINSKQFKNIFLITILLLVLLLVSPEGTLSMVIRFAHYRSHPPSFSHTHRHAFAEKSNMWLYVCSTPINISKSKFRILIHNTAFFFLPLPLIRSKLNSAFVGRKCEMCFTHIFNTNLFSLP